MISSTPRTVPGAAALAAAAPAGRRPGTCILQCNIIYVQLSGNYFSCDYDMEQNDYIR